MTTIDGKEYLTANGCIIAEKTQQGVFTLPIEVGKLEWTVFDFAMDLKLERLESQYRTR